MGSMSETPTTAEEAAARSGVTVRVATPEDLPALLAVQHEAFVALADGSIAGTVRAEVRDDCTVEIGRLAVAGSHLRRGVALALMLALEESYPGMRRFELFTGAGAAEPLALYRKLGYEVFRETAQGHAGIVWLAREAVAPARPTARPAPPLH